MYKCVCVCARVCVHLCVNIRKLSWVELLGNQNLVGQNDSRNISMIPGKT